MKKQLSLFIIAAALTLSACGNDNSYGNKMSSNDRQIEHTAHSSSGDIPEDLKVAENPAFKVGSKAIIQTDHMEGMKGATATIVGAFDTTAYMVSYRPTTGGMPITNHKWIIHEEIRKAANTPYESGSEVEMEADHMKDMKGARAQINAAEKTTVYMIDYMPTTGGDEVENHKWVTEDELSPLK
ncbi:YdhK family protein [Paenibacillus sp. FSL R10-2734]|uniref:YdhK family protein n=1 Tax=Paenibacillus sp. FSL R10-2734 TaxID=2954691 RepID=UPI0030DB135C